MSLQGTNNRGVMVQWNAIRLLSCELGFKSRHLQLLKTIQNCLRIGCTDLKSGKWCSNNIADNTGSKRVMGMSMCTMSHAVGGQDSNPISISLLQVSLNQDTLPLLLATTWLDQWRISYSLAVDCVELSTGKNT